ncbi:peptidase dimerization domain-containing protein, partial [Lactococcus cremoris]|uniref:peptidase dimerization domain-containing protein n=1 Tax=Lactococcus lactis subsp. cremoris TaxID=1359 RepID=UPI0022B71791
IKTVVIAYHNKETQTGRFNFTITIKGKGGHASMPQLSNDAIVVASYFVNEVQTVISRRIDPFDMGTVTIGSFDGEGSFNAIQDKVVLKGDVRMLKEPTRKVIRDQVKQIAKGVGVTCGVEVIVDDDDNYPCLLNTSDASDQTTRVCQGVPRELSDHK